MTHRASTMILLSTLGLVACGGAGQTDEATSQSAQRIVNGTPSTSANDAVVRINIGAQGGFCTGTLIAPNLVITARHCLSNINESSQCGTFTSLFSPSTLTIGVGVGGGGNVARGKQSFVETSSNSGCSHDIGLLLLDRDVPNAKTAPVRLYALTVGETASTVGYGDNGHGQVTSGRYEKTGLKIDAVGPSNYTYKTKSNQSLPVSVPSGEIVTGESTCFGDSGGPLFDGSGNVIGVTSRGIDDSCIDRPSIYSDTASHAALVKQAATASGHLIVEATPGGTPPSNDPEKPGTNGRDPAPSGSAGDADGTDDSTAETKPKKKSSSSDGAPVANSGCSAAPRGDAGALALALGVGLVLVLASRRRRRRA